MRTATAAPWEPSAWLRGALARRQAAVDALADLDPASLTVVTPVGPTAAPGSREDRTCDRCRVYVAPTRPGAPVRFFSGGVWTSRADGLRALVTFGLCRRCLDAEGIPAEVVA